MLVQIIWMAMERLWQSRNKMEHGTTKKERSLNQTARMYKRLKKAFSRKSKVLEITRIQIFQIPICHRRQYKMKANEQWLENRIESGWVGENNPSSVNLYSGRTYGTYMPRGQVTLQRAGFRWSSDGESCVCF